MTLTTPQQLNGYQRVVAWPQTNRLNAFIYLGDRHFYHFLASDADHPTPQQICTEKYKCTGLHFLIPCLETNTKYQIKIACKCVAIVTPSSENNSFSMQTLINVQSVDILLLKYTPDLPFTFCQIDDLLMFTGL